VVSLHIVVQVGSRNEVEPGRSGFAHFFEHMMFRGTPEYPPEKYEAVLQSTGASSNAYTDDDRTVYHTTVGREDFDAILAMEADRFQNLSYPEEDFRTEALAVLGEYNKDSAEPVNKLMEVLRNTAFDRHTYKHTTMGFLADIERMPEMYGYSKEFFNRFYRPEYTILVVAGDIAREEALAKVERCWGGWARGSHTFATPGEPDQSEPRQARIDWASPTLPLVLLAQRAPAYADDRPDGAALDLISFLGFAENSALYRRLVIEEQITDSLVASNPDRVDPYLFSVLARVKDSERVDYVVEAIRATLEEFAAKPVEPQRLEAAKSHLRYQFALGLDNTESIAETVACYVSLRRTPATINRLYETYAALTPEDLQDAARRWLSEKGRTTVILAHRENGGAAPCA
jgi:zinc protease